MSELHSAAENRWFEAEQLITKRHLKATDKRSKLLALMLNEDKPLSAYEITDKYNQVYGERIAANSIYRILDWLADVSLVHKLTTINKFVVCKHDGCDHHSAFSIFYICRQCQKSQECVASPTMIEELSFGAKHMGFASLTQSIELTGVCDACKSSESK